LPPLPPLSLPRCLTLFPSRAIPEFPTSSLGGAKTPYRCISSPQCSIRSFRAGQYFCPPFSRLGPIPARFPPTTSRFSWCRVFLVQFGDAVSVEASVLHHFLFFPSHFLFQSQYPFRKSLRRWCLVPLFEKLAFCFLLTPIQGSPPRSQ